MSLVLFGGLPRSGSTLLLNILSQNPDIAVKAPSGLLHLLTSTNHHINNAESESAKVNDPVDIPGILNAIVHSYHKEIPSKIVIDKDRMWPSHVLYMNQIMQDDCKVILCVRNLWEVVNSFRKLIEKDIFNTTKQSFWGGNNYIENLSSWLNSHFDSTGADAIRTLTEQMFELVEVRGYGDNCLFVDYHKLCQNPRDQLYRIYNFLEVETFNHQLDFIEQNLKWNDAVFGFGENLHKIENKLQESNPDLEWIQKLVPEDKWNFYNKMFWERYI